MENLLFQTPPPPQLPPVLENTEPEEAAPNSDSNFLSDGSLKPDAKRDKFQARLRNNTMVQIQRLMKFHKISLEDLLEFLKSEYSTDFHEYLQKQRMLISREHKRQANLKKARANKNTQQ